MGIGYVLGLAAVAILSRLVGKEHAKWMLLVTSILVVYMLQPPLPIRNLDFWLPTLTVMFAIFGWLITRPVERAWDHKNWVTAGVIISLIVFLGIFRDLVSSISLTASLPPKAHVILIFLFGLLSLCLFLYLSRLKPYTASIVIIFLVIVLFALKSPPIATVASTVLRWAANQDISRAEALDIRWLGFSYVVFRLIHTLRDRQLGLVPDVDLREYLIYIVFFPTLVAGPIDRLERFHKDLDTLDGNFLVDFIQGAKRLVIGIGKKFILADLLAIVSLNGINIMQVGHSGWLWVLLYAYTFQIYLDFSGYTDIAIGLGRLIGIRLPENFQAPYLKPNLTLFWNSWHMTLTHWFRSYYFNPFTRWMRKSRWNSSISLFVGQLSTMVLIGLWHGVTWNFALWGAWHGLGLFLQNRWSAWITPRIEAMKLRPRWSNVLRIPGTLITFHYVAIGWVWFLMPEPGLSLNAIGKLLGWK